MCSRPQVRFQITNDDLCLKSPCKASTGLEYGHPPMHSIQTEGPGGQRGRGTVVVSNHHFPGGETGRTDQPEHPNKEQALAAVKAVSVHVCCAGLKSPASGM